MTELLNPSALKNLLKAVIGRIPAEKLGGAGAISSILSQLGGGGAGGLLGSAAKALGGAKGILGTLGGNSEGTVPDLATLLPKLATAATKVLGSGSLSQMVMDVFKSNILEGNPIAAVASKFGITETQVGDYSKQAVSAIGDEFAKTL